MVFLPIVERELRVASRKPGTIGWRVLAAVLALFLGAAFLLLSQASGMSTVNLGHALFGTLTWLTLGVALAAGLFFTADSLSQEKREGTLGFLFLTDLSGFDVVGGKLAATSLRGSFALLAVFPILAVTLLMGGVTGAQFWQTCLALINALFCSLAAGLLVSSLSTNSQRALAATFVLLIIVCTGGPIADAARMGLRGRSFQPLLSFTSPAYVFWAASAWGNSGFWIGLLISHGLSWAWLACAGLVIRRTWQDQPLQITRYPVFQARSRPLSRARSRKLLEPNPVVWLCTRGRRYGTGLWVLAALAVCGVVIGAVALPPFVWMIWGQINWILLMGLYLWAAAQGSGFLVEARRNGLLELLLVTPLNGAQVIAGQWRGLLRAAGCPVGLLVLVGAAGSLATQSSTGRLAAANANPAFIWTLSSVTGLIYCVVTAVNLVTLVWVGMWMGLSSKNGGIAALKTLLFVQFLPWLAISFASVLISGLLFASSFISAGLATSPSANVILTFPLIMSGVAATLTLVKDAAFLSWARTQLRARFREQASQIIERRWRVPPVLLTTPTPPPLQK